MVAGRSLGGFLDQIILGELALLSQGNSKRVFESMNSDFIKKRVPDTKKRVKILLSAIDNCLLGADYAHKSLIDSFTDGLEKKFVKGTYFLGKDKDEDDYMAYTNAALAIAYMTREYRKNG